MCIWFLNKVFDDKRIAVVLLMIWLSIVFITFADLGLFTGAYMQFGPSEDTKFLGVVLNTYYRWGLVVTYTFISTLLNDFFSDSLSPWLLNTITDQKSKYLPYSKLTCLMISQTWSIYCCFMGIFSMLLSMSQFDFLLVRLSADLLVTCYTNTRFMRNKIHDAKKYHELYECDVEMNLYRKDDPSLDTSQLIRSDTPRPCFSIGPEDASAPDSNA